MQQLITLSAIFFSFLAIVVVIPAWLRHRSRLLALSTIRAAVDNNRPADAALIERLLMPAEPQVGKWFALLNLTLGAAALCIGIALALAVELLGIVSGASAAGMMVGSLVNGCIGAGLLTLGILSMKFFSGVKRPPPRWDYASVLALISLFLGTSGLSVASGLALSAYLYVAPAGGQHIAAGLLMGALVNGCSGIGFTALGVFILRAFATTKDA